MQKYFHVFVAAIFSIPLVFAGLLVYTCGG